MLWLKSEYLLWASSAFIYLTLTSIIALGIAWLFKRQRKLWQLRQIPCTKGFPILGNVFEREDANVRDRITQLLQYSKLGEVVQFWIGSFVTCMINTAKGAEVILSSQKYIDKGRDYSLFRDWLGDSLPMTTGSKWHSRRKLLTPAFHFKILENFIDVFNTQSSILMNRLQEKADGKPFDVYKHITFCTLDIICETAMGRSVNAQINLDSEYVKALNKLRELNTKRLLSPWLRSQWLFKLSGHQKVFEDCLSILHKMSRETIKERKALLQNSNEEKSRENEEGIGKKKRLAFLDLLLEYSEGGAKLSDEDIREEVDSFMFAGHDTTAATINWTLYLLGHHPEIQVAVHNEMDSIFGDSDRFVTMNDLREMKLLENCIKETLRIYPSASRIFRTLSEDVQVGDYLIPGGTNVMIFIYGIHRDPEQFPDPEKFDPDRFLPENSKHRHPYAYIPFSAGPRNCIGQKFAMMEEKVVLSHIIRKFRIESEVPRENLCMYSVAILRAKGGNIVKLFPRSKHMIKDHFVN